ncbi:ABC-type branched-chain amino acid transport system, substrate-binding protein [Kaistia soli DSM 19436]|uniref:ABC-type branched-chain amino acid transport system, substrate-binding protein n=1 Tax=Kaistia soli DSM 19436 TaxID=1122133 RepID=A0A1M4U1A6_9HYPH|nr:substrate-binding domain-containing protein [Kaistia soli]SHE50509.1 ABC-type branched-chain amino acid transport system, substrate-binding protein [Kaistia soli DSM 19436]
MKVGLLHPRSGIMGMWAPAMDAAATLGAAELNAAGGILGEEIELVFGDCGFAVSQAVDAVDTLIEVDGAEVIIGGHTSNIRDAVSQRISSKVPYIFTPQYEGLACGPSTVAIGSTDQELLGPALHWLRHAKGAERFFFVGNDYIWPRMALSTTRRLLRRQGGELVGQAIMPTRLADNSEVLKKIAASGAQVVIQALVGLCSVEFNRAFAAAGLDQKMLRFGLIVDETVICGIGADASTNLFTAASYFAVNQSRSNDHFLELYHDAFGAFAPPVSAASVSYYEALHVLAGLARDLGTRDSRALANHLHRPISRPAVRHMLDNKPVGQIPPVYIGRADGVRLEVVKAMTR